MASRGTKFGTFGGVFTPSLLTILGVIMYLRLPWVVGNAGIYLGLGIILVAHIVSISTGLSISSIATDKRAGAGGPYYIVSRSLGLPIGGTLGLALFLGFSLSISFYTIGFAESFLTYWRIGLSPETGLPSANALRICGTATVVLLTAVTLVSTALAIKTQYLILGAIALSLLSIALGHPGALPSNIAPASPPPAPSTGVLFGIFFPAVTGFTAGVNMSGDLRDPNRSLPRGTMAAIGVGFVVYVGLALFMLLRVPRDQLIYNPRVLLDLAWSPALVVAGTWGATLSSSISSILSAPRILQALGADRVVPRLFAHGQGASNEPRRALLLAFAIGEAGILVAELDAIAGMVSMVFLATYAFLNLSCAIETWASPDFRPAFRIPTWLSLVGLVTCVVVMIQIDLPAMFAATALLTGLFFVLERRQLVLDSGDTREGIWSSLVRAGLQRLSGTVSHERNWRPNMLLFTRGESAQATATFELGQALTRGRGLLTRFELQDDAARTAAGSPSTLDSPASPGDPAPAGVFSQRVICEDCYATVEAACRFHGYAGLAPNAAMLDWYAFAHQPEALRALLTRLRGLDVHVLLSAQRRPWADDSRGRVDIWWAPGRGHLPLSVALVRFLTSDHRWRGAPLRFLLFDDGSLQMDVDDGSLQMDGAVAAAKRLLAAARIDGSVQPIRGGVQIETFEQAVRQESGDADLTIIGWSAEGTPEAGDDLAELSRLVGELDRTLLLGAARSAADISFSSAPMSRSSALEAAPGSRPALPPLRLPQVGELRPAALSFDERHLVLIRRFFDEGFRTAWDRTSQLHTAIETVLRGQLGTLERAMRRTQGPLRARAAARIERSALLQCQRVVEQHAQAGLREQQSVLERCVDDYLHGSAGMRSGADGWLIVRRAAQDFDRAPDDTRYVARIKRWALIRAQLTGGTVEYGVPVAALVAHYLERSAGLLVADGFGRFRAASQRVAAGLDRLLRDAQSSLAELRNAPGDGPELAARVVRERERLAEQFVSLRQLAEAHQNELRVLLERRSRALAQSFCVDLERLDLRRRLRKDRRPIPSGADSRLPLHAEPRIWRRQQQLLLEQARVALLIATVRHRLRAVAEQLRDRLVPLLEQGLLKQLDALLASLDTVLESVDAQKPTAPPPAADLYESLDPRRLVDELLEEAHAAVMELPEAVAGVPEESLARLEEGRIDETQAVEIPLRRRVQYLLETKLVAGAQGALAQIPAAEGRAMAATHEVVRLLHFHWSELEEGPDGEPDEDARSESLRTVLEEGLKRLRGAQAELRALGPAVAAELDRHVVSFLRATEPRALLGSQQQLEQNLRTDKGRKALAGFRRAEGRAATALSRLFVRALYRSSTGALVARRLRATAVHTRPAVGNVVDRVASLGPRPEVLRSLPFYYQQLFVGQAPISESFWVGRQAEIAQAAAALERFKRGTPGILLVTGGPGEGKSALCNLIASRVADPAQAYRVHPPRGGNATAESLQAALRQATRLQGDAESILQTLPQDSLVLIDDLELWWERSDRGVVVLERLRALIDQFADRCFFVLGVNSHTAQLIDRLVGLSHRALGIVECRPIDAETIMSIVMLRHRAAGRTFMLDGRREDANAEWRLARLFNAHFEYSRGNVRAALLAWIPHIDHLSDDVLTIRRPTSAPVDLLEGLEDGWAALLLELVLHKQTSRNALGRITGRRESALRGELEPLLRMGLVTEERQDVLELNRNVRHLVVEGLRVRGWLR